MFVTLNTLRRLPIGNAIPLLGLAACALSTASFAHAKAPPKAGRPAAPDAGAVAAPAATKALGPLVRDWGVLGSGCKKSTATIAGGSTLGIGTLRDLPEEKSAPKKGATKVSSLELTLSLPDYELLLTPKERKPNQKAKAGTPDEDSLASECSFRAGIYPLAGMRIKNVTARTRYEANKSKESQLLSYARLKVGAALVGSLTKPYESGAPLNSWREEIELLPGRNPEEATPEIRCGEEKLLQLDLGFIGKLAGGEKVSASLKPDRKVVFVVDFEDCAMPN